MVSETPQGVHEIRFASLTDEFSQSGVNIVQLLPEQSSRLTWRANYYVQSTNCYCLAIIAHAER